MVAVAITASNRAVAVQRWLPPPGPLAKAAARQRSSVATLTPTSRETRSTAELSGGNNRATIRSLYACPYLANFPKPTPPGSRSYPGGNFYDTGGGGGGGPAGITGAPGRAGRAEARWRRLGGCWLPDIGRDRKPVRDAFPDPHVAFVAGAVPSVARAAGGCAIRCAH